MMFLSRSKHKRIVAELEGALASSNLAYENLSQTMRRVHSQNETKEQTIVLLQDVIRKWQKLCGVAAERIQELEEQRHGVLVALGYDYTPAAPVPGVQSSTPRGAKTPAPAGPPVALPVSESRRPWFDTGVLQDPGENR